MTDDSLHDVLAKEFSASEDIVPSAGFATSVMDAVHREAAIPPPIPFPWKWALPGAVVCLAFMVVLIAKGIHAAFAASASAAALPVGHLPAWIIGLAAVPTPIWLGAEWALLALGVSLLAAWIPMHFTARE